jgi:TPR repeat protein
MADVFISYSKQAPQPTRDLARDLEARGFTVWWDTELLAGDEFHERIKEQITAARVAVVIWSPASIKSSWVQAEATLASGQNKLLTVCTPDTDVAEVPLPFNLLHIEKIAERDRIVAAFAARGLLPRDEAKAKIARRAEELYQQAIEHRDGRSRSVDIPEAIKLLQEAVRLDHVLAKVALASLYTDERYGLQQRPAEALRLLYEAKAAGDLGAGMKIALMHFEGTGIPKDTHEGFRLLQETADANFPLAISWLGLVYHNGLYETPRSIPLALKYYERGATLGDEVSMYELADIYLQGDGVPKDWQRGIDYLKKSSDLGWVPATVRLAVLMIEGIGDQKDVAGGLAILEQVARTADGYYRAHALAKLGHIYLFGVGAERDVRKGLDLIHQAAELGDNKGAGTELGILYDEGKLVPRDESKALAFLERAAKAGAREATAHLGQMHMLRRNFDEGLKLLHDAERRGSGRAAATLALCYQVGVGVARDLAEAQRWSNVARSRGVDV